MKSISLLCLTHNFSSRHMKSETEFRKAYSYPSYTYSYSGRVKIGWLWPAQPVFIRTHQSTSATGLGFSAIYSLVYIMLSGDVWYGRLFFFAFYCKTINSGSTLSQQTPWREKLKNELPLRQEFILHSGHEASQCNWCFAVKSMKSHLLQNLLMTLKWVTVFAGISDQNLSRIVRICEYFNPPKSAYK